MDNNLPINDDSQNSVTPAQPQADISSSVPQQPSASQPPVSSIPPVSEPVVQPATGIDSISGAEGAPIVEAAPTVEQAPQTETISTPVEKLPTPEVPVAPALSEQPSESVAPVQPVAKKTPEEMNVVDKRTNHEPLDSLQDTSDKLTKEADEEEEDFIKHVEEVHTIKQ